MGRPAPHVEFIPLGQAPTAARCTLPGSLPCYPLPLPRLAILRAAWGGGFCRLRRYVRVIFSALRCRACHKTGGLHLMNCPRRPWVS